MENTEQLLDYAEIKMEDRASRDVFRAKLKDIITRVSNGYMIPLSNITVRDEFNKRKDFGDLESLMLQMMETEGNLTPAFVLAKMDGTFALVDGERRYKGLTIIKERHGIEYPLLAFVLPKETSESEMMLIMYYTQDTKHFNQDELAAWVESYIKLNKCTGAEVAKRIGKTPAYISQLLSYRKAIEKDPELQQKVLTKETTVSKVVKSLSNKSSREDTEGLERRDNTKSSAARTIDDEHNSNGEPIVVTTTTVTQETFHPDQDEEPPVQFMDPVPGETESKDFPGETLPFKPVNVEIERWKQEKEISLEDAAKEICRKFGVYESHKENLIMTLRGFAKEQAHFDKQIQKVKNLADVT